MTYFIKKEVRKFLSNWKLYVLMVVLFTVAPAFVKAVWYTYAPLDVLIAEVQPFQIEKTVVEAGGVNAYRVQATKKYDFAGRAERRLVSLDCGQDKPVDGFPSNNGNVRIDTWSTFDIPGSTRVDCSYYLEISVVYCPVFWRCLEPVRFRTDEFLVLARLPKPIKEFQAIQFEEILVPKLKEE